MGQKHTKKISYFEQTKGKEIVLIVTDFDRLRKNTQKPFGVIPSNAAVSNTDPVF